MSLSNYLVKPTAEPATNFKIVRLSESEGLLPAPEVFEAAASLVINSIRARAAQSVPPAIRGK